MTRVVWVAIGSALMTAVVMYLIMRPDSMESKVLAPTEIATVDASPFAETSSSSLLNAPVSPAPQPSSSVPSATPSRSTPEFQTPPVPVADAQPTGEVEWITLDAELLTTDDVWNLDDAPEGFQDFASSFVGVVDEDGCTPGIWVYSMHPDGFVYGTSGYEDCGGGAHIVWSNRGGDWAELFGFNGDISCYDLADAGVPEDVGDLECFADEQMWHY